MQLKTIGNAYMSDVEKVDKILPQTQCKKCGYASCRPYAEAIVFENENINKCPPGGNDVMKKLAQLMNRDKKPIDPLCGEDSPPALFIIDEANCIGCGLCIPACPVDAIAGASKYLHTIIRDECTGCELCVLPCPVDCINLIERPKELEWNEYKANASREKFRKRQERLNKETINDQEKSTLDQLKKKYIRN